MITVHRNLNVSQAAKKTHLFKPGQVYKSGCLWVVPPCTDKGTPSGPVEGYRMYLALDNARSKVGKTPKRVEQGRRAVFARIYGTQITTPPWSPYDRARLVSFDPFNADKGFFWLDTGEPCNAWSRVSFDSTGMWAI